MFPKARARLERRLVALIVAITVVPLAILVWLGWRLIQQDRLLEQQQVQQRVEHAADLLVAALQRALADADRYLGPRPDPLPDGAVVVTFRHQEVEIVPVDRVAFVPIPHALPEPPTAAFASGEALEFRQRDLTAASSSYSELAKSGDPRIRAGALLRLGRTLANAGRTEEALAAYARLRDIDGVAVDTVPVDLIARYARCRLLEELHRAVELRAEADDLGQRLRSGRWSLTRSIYTLYASDVARWLGASGTALEAETLGDAVDALWQGWRSSKTDGEPAAGRKTVDVEDRTFTVSWQVSPDAYRALVATPRFVESQWLTALESIGQDQHTSFGLRDATGKRSVGPAAVTTSVPALRSAADSGLPWTIVASSVQPAPEHREFQLRQRLLIAGLIVVLAMAAVAGYAIVRAVGRELAVVRLQSDFVAAVSHEFRTPLTALRQFTDMLRDNRNLDDAHRQIAYDAQSRATDRLTRLVESLLDFGRMEAGARSYHFELRDCADLVRRVVEEFQSDANATGHAISLQGHPTGLVEIDDEAMSRAVRNLLDNAVKYSPQPSPIEVGLDRQNGHVTISVRDYGLGISPHEKAHIFTKFHRGDQARLKGIKGTGIGLAMVQEIVHAHRGRVEVTSEPGQGSLFTLVLPVAESGDPA